MDTTHKKRSVRINDEVTIIPLLTSAAFFHKTPKPTVTTSGYGLMARSFRIVTPPISEEDSDEDEDTMVPKSSLWWTKEERKEILQANQKTSREFKRFHPTQVREANLVYDDIVMDCSYDEGDDPANNENDICDFFQSYHRANRSAASTCSSTATKSKKRKRDGGTTTTAAATSFVEKPLAVPDTIIDLPAHVRGLEWGVLPDAKRYRKAHARTVLHWQERFRRNDRKNKRRKGHKDSQDAHFLSHTEENDPQDLILGQKASISSRRSCILARVFGNSDALSVKELWRVSSRSRSPTPSLTSTSGSSSEDEEDDDDSSSSDSESDSDDSESDPQDDDDDDSHDSENESSFFQHSSYVPYNSSVTSHRRMFRPRMLPPSSWR